MPNTYRMCDIDLRILKQIEKELKPLFKNFKMKKIKKPFISIITNI